VAGFAGARVDVHDMVADGPAWCAEHFGCTVVGGEPEAEAYDLIWLGSVFTHLNPDAAVALLNRLKRGLRLGGLLIFTSRGRYSAELVTNGVLGLSEAKVQSMMEGYHKTGYGFADYEKHPGYGVSTVKPTWYTEHVTDSDFLQVLLQEKGWTSNQDVQGFMRLPLMRMGNSPVYAAEIPG
jgi:SAM-dependent methyltransferase